MKLQYPKAYGNSCIFREDFTSWQHVADNGGIVTGVPTISNGIQETVFHGTNAVYNLGRNWFVLAQQRMTLILDFTTTAAPPGSGNYILWKGPYGGTSQFTAVQQTEQNVRLYLPASIGDTDPFIRSSPLSNSTRYRLAFVYDGTLAGNSNRIKLYTNGVQDVGVYINGTIPANLLSASTGLEVLTANSIIGTKINQLRIFDRALSADEILDDYQQDSILEVELGP